LEHYVVFKPRTGKDQLYVAGTACTTANRFLVHCSVAVDVAERLAAAMAELVDGPGAGTVPDGAGFFYPPTVLDAVPTDSRLLREEIFGPAAPITRFDAVADAVAAANDTDHRLAAYVYTRDLAAGLRPPRPSSWHGRAQPRHRLRPGRPFGGVKQSGLGREGGHMGLLEYTEAKYIATD
jgi:succinate-semialdehyde dehydrogenase/glutarate-semialdehyde dehydrogenase